MRFGYWLGLFADRLVHRALWWPRFAGRENIPEGPFLVCANHRSWFDPPLVALLIGREIGFLAKSELFANPIFGRLIWYYNARPVRRGAIDRTALAHVANLLQRGKPVLVFPEGTRSRTGRMLPPKPGVGLLARRSGVPVLPVYIAGNCRLPRRIFRWGRLRVRVGPPILFAEIAAYPDDKDGYRTVSRLILDRICALSDDPAGDRADAFGPSAPRESAAEAADVL